MARDLAPKGPWRRQEEVSRGDSNRDSKRIDSSLATRYRFGDTRTVKRWLRGLLLYAPGIALLVSGVVVLLTVPLSRTEPSCRSCAAAVQYDWTGLILVAASAIYSSSVFIALRIARGWFEHWPRPLN